MSPREEVIVGLDFPSVSNINSAVSAASEAGYSRFFVPSSHPRYKREFDDSIVKNLDDDYSRSLTSVMSYEHVSYMTGKISENINVDSSEETFRKYSEKVIDQEIQWCEYLGIPYIMISLPEHGRTINLSRIVNSKLKQQFLPTFIIKVPMVSPTTSRAQFLDIEMPIVDSWHQWNRFRTYCSFDKRLMVALEISDDLPEEEELQRWLGEPVACIILKTKTFLSNQAGFPVLSKAHQRVTQDFLFRNVPAVISGVLPNDLKSHYVQYIKHLNQRIETDELYANFVKGYEDFLQVPLQPLMHNLDQYTYEVFEKDPVKYREYQRAMKLAFIDISATKALEADPIVVMIVGAGRGPLVNAALNASKECNVKIKLYALEKNPHAVVALQTQKLQQWKDDVIIIAADMRKWKAPEKADVLVSELLGSFGDNELSPECLDGAQRFLKDDGISIPCSYSSYICPTQSHKIHAEIIESVDRDKPYYHRFEQPYVVHLQTVYQISDVQKLFTFDHPNKDEKPDNTRFRTIHFDAREDCMVHGFSGFFDTILYKDVVLSIVPETHSQGMFSWFPVFFPIKESVPLKKGEKISISLWRLNDEKNVWYEWLVDSPVSSIIHNPNGRSYFIGLS